jgi:hypothetical protein
VHYGSKGVTGGSFDTPAKAPANAASDLAADVLDQRNGNDNACVTL